MSGEIVACSFSDEYSFNKVQSTIYPYLLKNMTIASIHNHPLQFGPQPSGKNFEMLGLEFEEFEIISSKEELWILESRDVLFDEDEINGIRKHIEEYYDSISQEVNSEFDEDFLVIDNFNKRYGDFLLVYINNDFDNIKLTRRYLDD